MSDRVKTCPRCEGSGDEWITDTDVYECSLCHGNGLLEVPDNETQVPGVITDTVGNAVGIVRNDDAVDG